MRKEEVGIVVEIDGKIAKVRASRHGDCKNCGACPGDSAIVVNAQNPLSAKVGQLVAFEIQETNMLQAAFIVYIMPLIAIFVGALVGDFIANKFGQTVVTFQICGGIIAFILAVIYIKLYDGSARKNEKMQPVITKILSKE
jgi:sigma-E factor negative regulatory protein RseC